MCQIYNTRAILFHNVPWVRKRVTQPTISLNGIYIEFVNTFDFLGLTLDTKLM